MSTDLERARAEGLVRTVREQIAAYLSLEVTDDESLALAGEVLAEVKDLTRKVDDEKRSVTGPLNVALKTVRSWFAPAETVLTECTTTLKGRVAGYHAELERRNAAALENAAAAVRTGDVASVGTALAELHSAPKIEHVALVRRWTYRVCNVQMVPAEYLCVDEAKVRAAMHAMVARGEDPYIPGITFTQETGVAVR